MTNSNHQILAIIEALGGKFTKEDFGIRHYFSYNGFELFMSINKGKYQIHICYPKHNHKAYNSKAESAWKELVTSINVGVTKTPDKVASDIKKRFDFAKLNEVKQMFADADAEYIQMQIDHKKLGESIVEKIGGKLRSTGEFRSDINFYPNYPGFEIEISHQSIKMEISQHLTVDMVATIYDIIKAAKL